MKFCTMGSPKTTRRSPPIDITEQLRRHLTGTPAQQRRIEADVARNEARRLARLVALEGLRLSKAGDEEGAKAKLNEAEHLEKKWRKLGGKGPLT
jgi:hypothetical protein